MEWRERLEVLRFQQLTLFARRGSPGFDAPTKASPPGVLQLARQHLARFPSASEREKGVHPAGLHHGGTDLAWVHVCKQRRRVLRIIVAERFEVHQQWKHGNVRERELVAAQEQAVTDVGVPAG